MTMKGYGIILLILGLGVLTGYWGIASDRMARSFHESQVAVQPAPEANAGEALCIKSDEKNDFKIRRSGSFVEFE